MMLYYAPTDCLLIGCIPPHPHPPSLLKERPSLSIIAGGVEKKVAKALDCNEFKSAWLLKDKGTEGVESQL